MDVSIVTRNKPRPCNAAGAVPPPRQNASRPKANELAERSVVGVDGVLGVQGLMARHSRAPPQSGCNESSVVPIAAIATSPSRIYGNEIR